ncbi:MAG: NAD(P)-dependent glycerol-3-phosphate dehydrogenase [Thermodesulfovibrionales bacterium]|nr:NAD(P)-dependent glycerol-3-phosphate dehydrogenase [Thermodesulfovibrionales bacterium]
MGYIAVIGAGNWGTTIACHVAKKDYDVSLWVYEPELAEIIKNTRVNQWYMPDLYIPEHVEITTDLQHAIHKARFVINAVPTQFIRSVLSRPLKFSSDAVIINLSKGIERGTLLTPSEILKELTGLEVAVLSGPSFAKEVAKGLPTAVTLATKDRHQGLLIQDIMSSENFRVYLHDDVTGVEIGGALKNVIAIASGIADGLGLGANARASLITRGLAEITRLGVAMGANPRTFSGLSGVGDLILTCTSNLSRNYTLGFKLGRGERFQDILAGMREVAEGLYTAEAACKLAERYSVEMPITQNVYEIIYRNKSPQTALQELMTRPLREEFPEL